MLNIPQTSSTCRFRRNQSHAIQGGVNSSLGQNRCDRGLKGLLTVAGLSIATLISAMPVPDHNIDSRISDARRLEKTGQVDAAILVLKQVDKDATAKNPEFLKVLTRQYLYKVNDLADSLSKRKYALIALDLAKRVLEEVPQDPEALIEAAAAYGKMSDFVDVKTKLEYSKIVYSDVTAGLRLNPDGSYGHLILAMWNAKIASLNPLLKKVAEIVYGQLPAASKEEAIAHFEKAIELAPELIVNHAEYAVALELMGNREQARAQWAKVSGLKAIFVQDRYYQQIAATRQ